MRAARSDREGTFPDTWGESPPRPQGGFGYRFRCWFGQQSNLQPDRYERQKNDRFR